MQAITEAARFVSHHNAGETRYDTGKTSSRGVQPTNGVLAHHSTPYQTTIREPRINTSSLQITNPLDIQRIFRVDGHDEFSPWGYDNPVRSRVNKGLLYEPQRGAHPRHATGAVRPPELEEYGLSGISLTGVSTRASKGAKANADVMTREDSTYLVTNTNYGGENMGQQLAQPLSTAYNPRRMYADTQIIRPASSPSDMAVLLNNPFVARNWNYDNLRSAIANGDAVDKW
jgi:Tfp pilus assembly protein PilP